jgi:adenylosuccinate lyase
MHSISAISPLDGRYASQTQNLQAYFSEYALIRYRIKVEVLYFIALAEANLFVLPANKVKKLHDIYKNFTEAQALAVKEIEKTTNHDVKAVEYFIKDELEKLGLQKVKEWVHFGLTSQDINNTAIPLLLKDSMDQEVLPQLLNIISLIERDAKAWKKIPLLARTHGQAASPTTLGKEMMVFVERLNNQIKLLNAIPFAAKFGGATGNLNAHIVAYPKIKWVAFANNFINKTLGLHRMQFTTQIEHYDMLAAHCDALKRIDNILIDYSRDIWSYVSVDYFKQKTKAGEIGSSAMPHKVNPIDFENAEGNLGIANALLEHLAAKLPISRLQRDLTDSTVLRNIGVPVGHIIIALNSLNKGINKLIVNEAKLHSDLEANWAVVAEAVQTILRRENYPNPYEALKDLTRGQANITQESMHAFIKQLNVSNSVKNELFKISPHNYVGNSSSY